MAYRTLFASLESETIAERVLPVAIALAKSQDAHLVGFHAIPAPVLPPTLGFEIPTEVWESMRENAEDKAKRIGQRFEQALGSEVGIGGEWHVLRSRTSQVDDLVLDHGRRADLILCGQIDADDREAGDPDLAGTLVLESGRPVLVIPSAGAPQSLGKTVFIAWNGSREAARAVFDALPLLLSATEVRLYGVNPDMGEEGDANAPGTELAAALARHGIKAVVENTSSSRGSVADELLSRMADRGSDLLVMGGYGHSRARERIFGGATRDILRSMTVPVLMSH